MPENSQVTIDAALVDALKDVVHVGDYGVLYVNDEKKQIHLIMGDSDGMTKEGFTGFDVIRAKVTAAVQPFWPGWSAGTSAYGGHDGDMEIADEWSPGGGDWREIGTIGSEAGLL